MDHPSHKIPWDQQGQVILEYIDQSAGLANKKQEENRLVICQLADGKELRFQKNEIEEVLKREDSEGKTFLQVNFKNGKKILLTDNLIGFKPALCKGLDMTRLPKVVTTPDLLSVVEAIEETLGGGQVDPEDLNVLRLVFDSVLQGAESVGFDLTSERVWLHQFGLGQRKACA